MKKIFLYIIFFALGILIIPGFVLNAANEVFVNDNGIIIQLKVVEKLEKIGYTLEDLKQITLEEYNDLEKIDIKMTFEKEQYIETKYVYTDEEILEQTDTVLSKEDYDYKVYKHKEKYGNDSFEKVIGSQDIMQTSTIMVIENLDDGGGGTSSTITKTKYESTSYKIFTLVGTYYSTIGTSGEFFVKTTLKWSITPTVRLVDLISLAFIDNVQIKGACYLNNTKVNYVNNQCPTGAQEYPDLEGRFYYTRSYESNYVPYYTTNYQVVVNGSQYTKYSYNVNESYMGVDFVLPSDVIASGGGSSGGSTIYYIYEKYYNFYFTLEARFTPTVTSINGTTFLGWYAHQTGTGKLDWGNVSISPVYPFFSYSTSFWVDDPSYDAGIGGTIIFSNIG